MRASQIIDSIGTNLACFHANYQELYRYDYFLNFIYRHIKGFIVYRSEQNFRCQMLLLGKRRLVSMIDDSYNIVYQNQSRDC